ncbi:hypothetical protein [Moraxella marmotae]|uniref:hypothetical protein n=1 Tax=Moraxella marmotae TaxID=3344520 RepID=UPI0035F44934
MKITLDKQELNQAVIEYLSNQGLTIDESKVSVQITSEGVQIDTNKPAQSNQSNQQPNKPSKPVNNEPVKPSDEPKASAGTTTPDEPQNANTSHTEPTKALFGNTASAPVTDDVIEDDTHVIPDKSDKNSVEKTRKLFQ